MNQTAQETADILGEFGIARERIQDGDLEVRSPIDGAIIGRVRTTTVRALSDSIHVACRAFIEWRTVPAPVRGELVRLLGEELRSNKTALGRLVTIESGKILSEGLGEVQEMIDICTFAAGLSRQLCGLTIATERPSHRMMETWHPLGVTGIISAFNFPVAVWSWNAALALVCGNSTVWKPSEKTPLTALATQALFDRAVSRFGAAPAGLSAVVIGGRELGEALVDDPRAPVISATGSSAMGRAIAPRLAARFARSILELGGNNAAVVCPSADLGLTIRGIAFAAIGTAGQRCTTLRRLIVHEDVHDELVARLKRVYASVAIGDPRQGGILVGPLIDERAFDCMQLALEKARADGGQISGGERLEINGAESFYVRPAIADMPRQCEIVRQETFAPILYVLKYKDFDNAIAMHNDVPQGLSSSIFTNDLREAERFVSTTGSDCGIANVNIGPSGAEIGGAFGGEKETGGGRESGSDSWKSYMRRATNTINFGSDLPLAQGVQFDIGP